MKHVKKIKSELWQKNGLKEEVITVYISVGRIDSSDEDEDSTTRNTNSFHLLN